MADIVVTAGSVLKGSDATVEEGIAGATVTAGQPVYKDSTDSDKLKLADANASLATAAAVGIALHGASSGQPLKYQTGGSINPGGTVAIGTIYVVSATAGGIATHAAADLTTAMRTTIIGVGTSASNIAMKLFASGALIP